MKQLKSYRQLFGESTTPTNQKKKECKANKTSTKRKMPQAQKQLSKQSRDCCNTKLHSTSKA